MQGFCFNDVVGDKEPDWYGWSRLSNVGHAEPGSLLLQHKIIRGMLMLPVLPEGKESFSADFSSLYVYFTKAHKLSDWCSVSIKNQIPIGSSHVQRRLPRSWQGTILGNLYKPPQYLWEPFTVLITIHPISEIATAWNLCYRRQFSKLQLFNSFNKLSFFPSQSIWPSKGRESSPVIYQ